MYINIIKTFTLFLSLIFLSSCIRNPMDEGTITLDIEKKSGAVSNLKLATVTNVTHINDTFIINGSNFIGTTQVSLNGQNLIATINNDSELVLSGALNLMSIAMNSALNLIITNAAGAAAVSVTFEVVDNSITSIKIGDGEVGTTDLADNAVTSAKIQNSAITSSKLNITGAAANKFLMYDGTNWVGSNLGALSYQGGWDADANNPDLSTCITGQYYIVSTATTMTATQGISNWGINDWAICNASANLERIVSSSGVTTLGAMTDTNITTPADKSLLIYDSGTSRWIDGQTSLSKLTDIDVGFAPNNNEVLTYDGTDWNAVSILSTIVSEGQLNNTHISALAASKLTGALPAIDGSLLTNLPAQTATGAASGDLTGTYPAPTLAAVGTAGTYTKVTTDAKGRVTSGTTLSATDIPSLDMAKITTGTLPLAQGGTNATTAAAARTNLGLVIGTDVQAYDADLDDLADGTLSATKVENLALIGTGGTVGQIWTATGGAALGSWQNAPSGADHLGNHTATESLKMAGENIVNTGDIELAAVKSLKLGAFIDGAGATGETGASAPIVGEIWYNTTSNEIKYHNGTAIQALGVAGSGLTSFNGATGSTQTFDPISTAGTTFGFSLSGNAHILNIPMASTAGVGAGLLSKTDYDIFNGKQNAITTGAGTQYLKGDLSLGTFNTDARTATISDAIADAVTTLAPTQNAVFDALALKEDAVTKGNLTEATSGVLTITGGTSSVIGTGTSIQVTKADTTNSGYLDTIDWDTFNNKQSALTNPVTATGLNHDNFVPLFNGINALDASPVSETELGTLDGVSATLTSAELNFIDGVTSSVQTQLNNKVDDSQVATTGANKVLQLLGTGLIDASVIPGDAGQWDNVTGGINYASGDVGIGEATPDRRLEVFDTDPIPARFTSSATIATAFEIKNTTSNSVWEFGVGGTTINNGMSPGDFYFYNSGVKMVIDNAGNVGIGNSNPSNDLVVGTQGAGGAMIVIDGTSGAGGTEGGEIRIATADDHDTTYDFWRMDVFKDDLRFGPQGDTIMTLAPTGKVGIGITTPDRTLHVEVGNSSLDGIKVNSANGSYIQIYPDLPVSSYNPMVLAGDSALIFSDGTTGSGNLVIAPWNSAANTGLRMDSTGNVGIGIVAPTQKLEVNGGIKIGTIASDVCTAAQEGTVRFKSNVFEGCNGTTWLKMGEAKTNIAVDTTLNVPADYADINAALAYLNGKTISTGAFVTIQVADGTYAHGASTIDLRHPNGAQIKILGNITTPANVVLTFTDAGIKISDSNSIKEINGFKLVGSNTGNGIAATNSASIKLGGNMIIEDFNSGVVASRSGSISITDTGFSVSSCVSGFYAGDAGSIYAYGAVATNNSSAGFSAAYNGYINAGLSTASSSTAGYGYLSQAGGYIYAYGATVTDNLIGAYAQLNGSLRVDRATFSSSVATGIHMKVYYQSYIYAINSQFSGTATQASPVVNTEGNRNSLIAPAIGSYIAP